MSQVDDEDAHYRYAFGMLVRHPTADLAQLLRPLGHEPDHSKVAGQPRMTPIGRPLRGTYRESFWSFRHLVKGRRDFMASVSALTASLMPHRDLLHRIRDEGGRVSVVVALPGSMSIGAVLDVRSMACMVALEASLDIEVFPHLDNFLESKFRIVDP